MKRWWNTLQPYTRWCWKTHRLGRPDTQAFENDCQLTNATLQGDSSHTSSASTIPTQIFIQGTPRWKRAMDITLSLGLLLALLPLLLLIALFIRAVSPGPIIFKQARTGYGGRSFTIWKFRTMHVDADTRIHQTRVSQEIHAQCPMTKLDTYGDPRIIPFGHILRQTGLDELPQLFNVLHGDMSLIGPRPDPVYAAQLYQPWHAERLHVRPGITGLWQVSGKNTTTFEEMVRLDIAYIRQQSLWLDLKIALLTIPAILKQVKDFWSHR
jgi:lipopolysaccharide/colanic/teichoic acid biosynthesis glycosyltransferase